MIPLRTIKIVPAEAVKIIDASANATSRRKRASTSSCPSLDSVRETIDMREQITKIEPQPVITRDNVTMEVDAVIYFVIIDPVRATYEVQNLRWGLRQLTCRRFATSSVSSISITLSSRDTTNAQLRAALDSATQQWGVKVMRIELKNITPPRKFA